MNPIALFLYLLSRTTAREPGYYDQLLSTFTFNRTIPKVIHQIFISPKNSDSDIPKRATEYIEIIKRLNLDFVYKLWTNNDVEEFIATNYGQCMLDYYMRIDDSYGAIKADLFRYLLNYKGGVYFDLKI